MLNEDVVALLVAGVATAVDGRSVDQMCAERDEVLTNVVAATHS
ncbi:MAG: hypothetical protein V9E81_09195 [Marmoricola sp.]